MDFITLDEIELPADMQWVDEFKSTQVRQVVVPSLTGASIVQMNLRQSARPITLEGAFNGRQGYAVVTRGVVEALRAKEEAGVGVEMELTFSDNRTFPVIFRYDDGPAIDAAPLKPIDPPEASDLYLLKLRLMTI